MMDESLVERCVVFKEGDGYTDGMATTTGWKVWNYDGGKVQRCLRKATGTRPGWQ